MILVDTSVWIDFFADRSLEHVDKLSQFLEDGEDICTCGIVLTEVLQGIKKEKDYINIKEYFGNFIYIPMQRSTFIKSAEIHRELRQKGITIRNQVDCMISALVMEKDVLLMDNDREFALIESCFELKRIPT